MPQVLYSSKLLLFGEYSIIHGGAGLSVPITQFYGHWDFRNGAMDWNDLFHFLASEVWPPQIKFNNQKLLADVAKGLYFESNIPQGFGLGSSAALTAAIFNDYFIKHEQLSTTELYQILAQIESHFHGKSSGIDPLVSYLNQEILIHATSEKKAVQIELVHCTLKFEEHQLFLYDTGIARNTKKLVAEHKKKFNKEQAYRKAFVELDEMNQRAINFIRNRDLSALRNEFEKISIFQYDFMFEMIPTQIKEDFKNLRLKLCGAGGGGYFLGICNKKEFDSLQKSYPLLKI